MITPKPLTPMMARYQRMKAELPEDALLMFRLGDFYEFFFEDARIAAASLKLTLTKRGDVPMCGIPVHAADGYIKKLIDAKHRVAISEMDGV